MQGSQTETTYHLTMFRPQVNHLRHHRNHRSPPLEKNPFTTQDDDNNRSETRASFLSPNTLSFPVKRHNPFRCGLLETGKSASQIKPVADESGTIKTINLKAVVTVQLTVGGALSNIFTKALDRVTDLLGKSLLLELVAAETDPKTGLLKDTIKNYAHRIGQVANHVTYLAEFQISEDFGSIGAIKIENEHRKEVFVESVEIEGASIGPVTVSCNSWVHSKFDNHEKRIFFVDKVSCLPVETPSGLKSYREKELATLRGDGVADKPRDKKDRIYDYDVYNDLGDPDKDPELARPVLGSNDYPHPRRCKTGQPRTKSDPLSESRSSDVYVPRDEAFSEVKNVAFNVKAVYSVLKAVIPSLETSIIDKNLGFPYFTAIDSLFNEGVHLPPIDSDGFLRNMLPRLLKSIEDVHDNILLFETPEMIDSKN